MLIEFYYLMKKFLIYIAVVLVAIFVLSSTSIFLPGADKDKKPDNNVDFSQLTYLAFGDSITHGDGLENYDDSYPCVVADILGSKVVNKGISGSTLGYITERHCIADDVLNTCDGKNKYQIISIMGGTNDIWWNIPLGSIEDKTHDTIYGSLNLIATTLKSNYPNAFVFFMTPLQNTSYEHESTHGYKLEDIANAVKFVANKHNIPVLDMFNEGRFEKVESGMNNPDCDGTHPLKEYVRDYMSPQIAQFIKDNYNK